MKEYICKSSLLLLAMMASLGLSAQSAKDYEGSMDLDRGQYIEIISKYGEVQIMEHDENVLRYEAHVETQGKDYSAAQKLLDRINIDALESSTTLRLETSIGAANRSRFSRFFRDADPFDHGNVNIALKIWVPKDQDISIESKYGDIKLEVDVDELDIKQGHGVTEIIAVCQALDYKADFSDLIADSLPKANLHLDFSRLDLYKVGTLDLNSKGSRIDIAHGQDLYIKSLRDNIKVKNAVSLNLNSTLSDVEVDHLQRRADMSLSNGSLELSHISKDFEDVFVDQKRADVELSIDHEHFALDMNVEDTDLSFPRSMVDQITKKEMGEDDVKIIEYQKDSGHSLIRVRGLKGEINFYRN